MSKPRTAGKAVLEARKKKEAEDLKEASDYQHFKEGLANES
jgi:hypothetical protein